MKIETIAIHAGNHPDEATGAVIQPVIMSTNYVRNDDGNYPKGYKYSRTNNPNRVSLEECLCKLEGGEAAAAFSSGSAAAMALFQALSTGDHVMVPDDMYHGIANMLRGIYSNWNLQVSFVNMQDLEAVENAFQSNTKLVLIESPSNPMMKISDIKAISDIAHNHKAIVACDNTFATPVLQKPFDFGVDLVYHATTKYLNGHSDVTGGIIVSKQDDDFFKRIREVQQVGGAVPSPFDCFLTLRGIRTLAIRMKVHSENAMAVAEYLSKHSLVEKVYYPGLKTHNGYDIASKQMKQFGGMISFTIKGDAARAFQITSKTKLFTRATSLGGVESLMEHRASMEGPHSTTPQNLLRLSVGLEHIDDLLSDLEQALE
jgi:cystathionine gamma-synthase